MNAASLLLFHDLVRGFPYGLRRMFCGMLTPLHLLTLYIRYVCADRRFQTTINPAASDRDFDCLSWQLITLCLVTNTFTKIASGCEGHLSLSPRDDMT